MQQQDIINYYDNFLNYLKRDCERPNPRHIKIKSDLKGIIKTNMCVLDLGCGVGVTTHYIAELGAKVIGVDLSPKLIEFAKENSNHQNIEYYVEDITNFNINKKFDVICLVDVMEHIPREKILDLIKNIERYAHESTIIYLNIPDARLQFWMQKNKLDRLQIIDEAYSITKILGWFKLINFEAIKIKIYGVELPLQYASYIFVKRNVISHNYNKYLKGG